MLEDTLTVPGTGHLLPGLVWTGSDPGTPVAPHQPRAPARPRGCGTAHDPGLWEELGMWFFQKTSCEDSHCDNHTCRLILQSMFRTAKDFGLVGLGRSDRLCLARHNQRAWIIFLIRTLLIILKGWIGITRNLAECPCTLNSRYAISVFASSLRGKEQRELEFNLTPAVKYN